MKKQPAPDKAHIVATFISAETILDEDTRTDVRPAIIREPDGRYTVKALYFTWKRKDWIGDDFRVASHSSTDHGPVATLAECAAMIKGLATFNEEKLQARIKGLETVTY